jgi:hypothetical protein
MLGQKIRANISLLHIVHRSELRVVFIIARVAVGGRELGKHRLTSGESTGVVPHAQQTLTATISPSHFHIVLYEVLSDGAGSMIILGGWATGAGQHALRMSISIRSARSLHDSVPTPPSKTSGVRFNGEPRPLGYQHPGTTGTRQSLVIPRET